MAMPSVYVKATLVVSSGGKDHFYNVFYYEPTESLFLGEDPMQTVFDIENAIWTAHFGGVAECMSTESTVEGLNIELHHGGNVYTASQLHNDPGTHSGSNEPDYVAVCIQKRTGNAGKSGRGRWFLGPVPDDWVDENYLSTAAITQYKELADSWKLPVDYESSNLRPCLFSKKNDTLTPIETTYVVPKLAVIGGRKRKILL